MSLKHFGKQLELPLLQSLGRTLLVSLSVYTVVRLIDLSHRGALQLIPKGGYEARLFLLELILCSAAPILLLMVPKVRESAKGLYLASVLCLLGFITNRMNIAITGMETSAGQQYFPKWTEIVVTLAIVGVGFLIFALAVRYLPIFSHEIVPGPDSETEVATVSVPELSHVGP